MKTKLSKAVAALFKAGFSFREINKLLRIKDAEKQLREYMK